MKKNCVRTTGLFVVNLAKTEKPVNPGMRRKYHAINIITGTHTLALNCTLKKIFYICPKGINYLIQGENCNIGFA